MPGRTHFSAEIDRPFGRLGGEGPRRIASVGRTGLARSASFGRIELANGPVRASPHRVVAADVTLAPAREREFFY